MYRNESALLTKFAPVPEFPVIAAAFGVALPQAPSTRTSLLTVVGDVAAPAGQPIPNITLRTEPIGARRLPDINLLHMRIEKAIHMSGGRKLALRLNIFNVTNINTEQSITQLSGVNFGRPGGVLPPRIAEIGAEYSF